MYKRGLINNEEYEVVGMKKNSDGSGYTLTFIIRDPHNEEGREVGTLFIPEKQAKTLGKFLLGKKLPFFKDLK